MDLIFMDSGLLFTKDSNGRLRFWSGKLVKNVDTIDLIVEYGLYEGNSHTTMIKYDMSKLDKAKFDLSRKIDNRINSGYFTLESIHLADMYKIVVESKLDSVNRTFISTLNDRLSINKTDKNSRYKPMKAQPYIRDKMEYPA